MAVVVTEPFLGQKPGTSGLRKTVAEFSQYQYFQNYIQSVFDCLEGHNKRTLIIGGDGRYPGEKFAPIVIQLAAANGFENIVVAQKAWLSTPAASHLVRKHNAVAAVVLTASHNPGGKNGDFGVKVMLSNGGPAPDSFARSIHQRSLAIREYRTVEDTVPDLQHCGSYNFAGSRLDVIDPVNDYQELMQRLFDFNALAELAESRFTMMFDGLNGVSGPYAERILARTLGFSSAHFKRTNPLPDFGGQYPDPNPVYAGRFHNAMMSIAAPDFGAACDSDADRHMIMGRGICVAPSDSLAILAQHMHLAPAYACGIAGVARSVGTSTAVDRVATHLQIPCFETPTGWKYFGNLLDAGLITLCGEESSGAGSSHIREKDGLWAVLLWLSIIAATRKPVSHLLQEHWQQFGRTYYERRDYEEIDEGACHDMLTRLRLRLPRLPGRATALGNIEQAYDFSYLDPVNHSISEKQGIVLHFSSGARIVTRLSGTGTTGATLRVYGERYDQHRFDRIPGEYLESLFDILDQIAGISAITRQYAPSLVT